MLSCGTVPPIIALNTTVRNDTNFDSVQETLAYSYQRSKVGTWNNTAVIEIGEETSFKAEVPFVASGGIKVSLIPTSGGGSEGYAGDGYRFHTNCDSSEEERQGNCACEE
jgi:Clostridium epsilon toxin ETX/Bacillus mosquitocidal toxin MTX2